MIKTFEKILSDFACVNEIWDNGVNLADTLKDIETNIPGRASSLMQTVHRLVTNKIPYFPSFDTSEFVKNLQLWVDFYDSKIDLVDSDFFGRIWFGNS